MCNWNKIIGLALVGFSAFLQAKTYIPQCPKEINTLERIQTSPDGWETLSGIKNNYLGNVSFYSGHPKAQASLKPNRINKKKAEWKFSPHDTIYIVCHYNQTGIELTQQLPQKTKGCTVIFNPNAKGPYGFLPQKITCNQ
ncbi:STY0301 family protein [Legionella pneumophila serogroup 1]